VIRLAAPRLGQLVFVFWATGSLAFLAMHLLPGDAAYRVAAGRYGYDQVSSAAAAAVRSELGLDQPLLLQYLDWLGALARLDLGTSLVSGLPVREEIAHLLGHTLLLAGAATALAALVALPVGIWAALRPGSRFDRLSLLVAVLLRAQPVFLIGLLLILAFALHWRLFPVAGFDGPAHLVLPATALALAVAAVAARVVRASARTALDAESFAFARTKGLPFRTAFVRHALPNFMLPVLAFLGIQLATLMEGVVMIESLFSWPGVGHGLAHAVFSRDVPMIQGAALAMGVTFVLLNLAIDLACHALDPRSRVP
jgi:peptide/nickel transport system permease protein